MYHERIQVETAKPVAPCWLTALVRRVQRELAYRALVHDLQHLTPELLADIDLKRGDIRRFARAATFGTAPAAAGWDDGPATSIGSAEWSRAYMLRLGSN